MFSSISNQTRVGAATMWKAIQGLLDRVLWWFHQTMQSLRNPPTVPTIAAVTEPPDSAVAPSLCKQMKNEQENSSWTQGQEKQNAGPRCGGIFPASTSASSETAMPKSSMTTGAGSLTVPVITTQGKLPSLSNVISTDSTAATPLPPPCSRLPPVPGSTTKIVRRNILPPTTARSASAVAGHDVRAGHHHQIIDNRRCASSSGRPGVSSSPTIPSVWYLMKNAVDRREENSLRSLMDHVQNDEELMKLVVDYSDDEEGFNLLHWAVAVKSPQILQTILDRIPCDRRTATVRNPGPAVNRYTPLHLATIKGEYQAATILLEHGADPNAKSKLDATPLHFAVSTSDFRLTKLLLDRGADPNAITQVGNMPLLSAVYKRSLVLVEVLLAAGANPRQSAMNGLSARALALRNNHTQILAMMDGSVRDHKHPRLSSRKGSNDATAPPTIPGLKTCSVSASEPVKAKIF